MEQRRRTIVERPKGIGKLTVNGATVAMVRYTLEKIAPPACQATPTTRAGARPGACRGYEVRGRLWSLDCAELGRHENVVLHLEDGRALAIRVTTRDGRGGYPLVGTGDLA